MGGEWGGWGDGDWDDEGGMGFGGRGIYYSKFSFNIFIFFIPLDIDSWMH